MSVNNNNLEEQHNKQIVKHLSENKTFQNQINAFLQGEMEVNKVINVCSIPNSLKILDSQAKKIVLNQSVLKNAFGDKDIKIGSHTEGHELQIEELLKIPNELRNPIMIIKGSKNNTNSVVCVTDMKNKSGENVIIPISVDRQNGKVNIITSLYGKKNIKSFLEKCEDRLLAVNIKKAEVLSRDIGYQLPKSIAKSSICYDDSIAYTLDNVKYPNNPQKSRYSIDDYIEEIKKCGFKPNRNMVMKYQELDDAVGRHVNMEQICIWYKGECPEILKEKVKVIGDECKQQQLGRTP